MLVYTKNQHTDQKKIYDIDKFKNKKTKKKKKKQKPTNKRVRSDYR